MLREVDAWDAASIETALRGLADELGLKPGQAFQPIRMAVTGSKVSPGLFESLELLGREETLRRLSRAVRRSGLGGPERVERPLELQPGAPPEGGARRRRSLAVAARCVGKPAALTSSVACLQF